MIRYKYGYFGTSIDNQVDNKVFFSSVLKPIQGRISPTIPSEKAR